MHQKELPVGHASVFRASHGETNYRSEGYNYQIQGDVLIGPTSRFKVDAIEFRNIPYRVLDNGLGL